MGLCDGSFARLRSPHGRCVLKVVVTENQRRGCLFVPIHWSDDTASTARIGELVTSANDPYSGQPESEGDASGHRACVVCLSRVLCWRAARRRCRRDMVGASNGRQRRRFMLASNDGPVAWRARASALLGAMKSPNISMSLAGSIAWRLFRGQAGGLPIFS